MKQKRIDDAILAMKANDLDAVIYGQSANLQYLLDCNDFFWQRACETNINGKHTAYLMPEVLLQLKSDGDYIIICNIKNKDYFEPRYPGHVVASYMDQYEDAIAPYVTGKKIGVGIAAFDYIKEMLKNIDEGIEVVDAEDLLKDIRVFKDADEIKAIREICKFTDDAVMYVVNNLKEGMSAREAENLLVEYGYKNNIDDLSFPPTCGFKTQNTFTTEILALFDGNWKLQPQTGVAFDVGFMKNGYCSDWGRSIYFGKAPEIVKKGYNALNEGILYMVSQIVPGKTNVNELFDLVAKKVEEMGMLPYLRHVERGMLGHQIGIDCHELPLLNREADFIIQPGMTFAVEPKMWFPNEMFMRVEDIVLVTETGAEILTRFPRDLFELDLKK